MPNSQASNTPFGLDKSLIHHQLKELGAGECYRLPKRMWGLERTMVVLRTMEGEYQLILETKGKLPNHTPESPKKTQRYKRRGTFKEGQVAWRIDKEEAKQFHLILKSNSSHEQEKINKEIFLSQLLGGQTKHILIYHKGLLRHPKDTVQRSLYALGEKGQLMKCVRILLPGMNLKNTVLSKGCY